MSARILVIDDEESIRFTFERFLTTEGILHSTLEPVAELLMTVKSKLADCR